MMDSRLNRAQTLLADALETGDSTYMRALIVEANRELTDLLGDW